MMQTDQGALTGEGRVHPGREWPRRGPALLRDACA